MASRQVKEQRAASDLSDVNREREQERHGVIGSVMKAVQSAKEAVVGKSHDEDGDQGHSRDTTMMAKETTESAARTLDERAREAAERTKQTAESAKEKTKDTAESAAEKSKETSQSAFEKLGELKDKAVGLLSGKKDEVKEKPRKTEEEAPRRMEEMRLTNRDEYEGEVARRVNEDVSEREKEYRGGGILGVLKGKLTPHVSSGEQARSADKSRVAGRNQGESRVPRTEEEKVVEVCPEDTPPGTIASDQMRGQTYNDVGQIDDEGIVRIVRQGKL